jgi:hypothetical protein
MPAILLPTRFAARSGHDEGMEVARWITWFGLAVVLAGLCLSIAGRKPIGIIGFGFLSVLAALELIARRRQA